MKKDSVEIKEEEYKNLKVFYKILVVGCVIGILICGYFIYNKYYFNKYAKKTTGTVEYIVNESSNTALFEYIDLDVSYKDENGNSKTGRASTYLIDSPKVGDKVDILYYGDTVELDSDFFTIDFTIGTYIMPIVFLGFIVVLTKDMKKKKKELDELKSNNVEVKE